MSEEQLRELQEYNLEYLEAQQSEEMFGGDYISAVELKYAKQEIDKLVDTNEDINREFSQYKYESKKEIERLNNIINELEKSKEKQENEYEILIFKIERYLNCYQYFLETQEENNKKIANMIHEFRLGSDKE